MAVRTASMLILMGPFVLFSREMKKRDFKTEFSERSLTLCKRVEAKVEPISYFNHFK